MNIPNILSSIEELTNNQKTAIVKDTFEKLGLQEKQNLALESINSLSGNEKKDVLLNAARSLDTTEKQEVAAAILGQPTQKVTDYIWIIIVIVFAFAFILSIGAMIYAAVYERPISDKLITVFTTTSAFLAALIAPSPIRK